MAIKIRDVELQRIARRQLVPHPQNPKIHGEWQRTALRAALGEIGFVGALIVRPLPGRGKRFQVLDGHCRVEEFGAGEKVPCLVISGLSDEQAAKLIATYDPLGDIAEIDPRVLESLTTGIEWESLDLSAVVHEVLTDPKGGRRMIDVGEGADPGEREPFQEMTFRLADEQAEQVREALEAAKEAGPFDDGINENSNGNALARIAEAYLAM